MNFLRRLFDKEFTDYDNFFNDVLEPLFYVGLASEHENDYLRNLQQKIDGIVDVLEERKK